MNEYKLSALMRYQGQVKKRLGCTVLTIAARFLKCDKPRSDKLSGSERKRLHRDGYALIRGETMMLPYITYNKARVLRGNPVRNPTALV